MFDLKSRLQLGHAPVHKTHSAKVTKVTPTSNRHSLTRSALSRPCSRRVHHDARVFTTHARGKLGARPLHPVFRVKGVGLRV